MQKRASFSGARHVRSRTAIRAAADSQAGTPFDQDLLQIFSALEDQARESARTYMLLAQSPCMAPRKLLSLAFCLFVSCFLSCLSFSLSSPLLPLSLPLPPAGRTVTCNGQDCSMISPRSSCMCPRQNSTRRGDDRSLPVRQWLASGH